MNACNQRMGAAVKELQGNVLSHIRQQTVVAHSECIPRAKTVDGTQLCLCRSFQKGRLTGWSNLNRVAGCNLAHRTTNTPRENGVTNAGSDRKPNEQKKTSAGFMTEDTSYICCSAKSLLCRRMIHSLPSPRRPCCRSTLAHLPGLQGESKIG